MSRRKEFHCGTVKPEEIITKSSFAQSEDQKMIHFHQLITKRLPKQVPINLFFINVTNVIKSSKQKRLKDIIQRRFALMLYSNV